MNIIFNIFKNSCVRNKPDLQKKTFSKLVRSVYYEIYGKHIYLGNNFYLFRFYCTNFMHQNNLIFF